MIRIEDKSYCSFKEALESIDVQNSRNIDIYIDGIVEGQQIINRPNITIHGGVFRNDYGAYTIMADGYKRGTFRSFTVYVESNNVTFVDTKILNDAGYNNGQAIALMVDADYFSLKNCYISSYQDTLFLGPLPLKEFEERGFVGPMENKKRNTKHVVIEDCVIEGSVDFVFGGACAYFKNCTFNSLKEGYVFAPSTKKIEKYGFICDGCHFVSNMKIESVYLARPWRNGAKLLLNECDFGKHIFKEGYTDWNKDMNTVIFKESGDISNRKYATKLTDVDLKIIEILRRRKNNGWNLQKDS